MGLLRAPDGSLVDVPDNQSDLLEAGGYTRVDAGSSTATSDAMTRPDSGALSGIGALASSTLSGATLGLSDIALKGLLTRGDFDQLARDRELHPVLSGVGQVTGNLLPMFAAPGSALSNLPAGVVSRTAMGGVEAAREIGGAKGALAALGVSGVEGSLYNAGAYLSDTALGDRELSAEGLAGALGSGFEFGAAGGVAAMGIEHGSIAARRMFSRLTDGGKRAYAEAEQTWLAKYQSTLEANDAAAEIARAKLAEAQLARQQADVYRQNAAAQVATAKAAAPGMDAAAAAEQQAASVAGMSDAERAAGLIADRGHVALAGGDTGVTSDIERQLKELAGRDPRTAAALGLGGEPLAAPLSPAAVDDLAAAVAEHDAARAELDDILRRIESPDVGQPGGLIGQNVVPVGEFGAPGARGFKTQGELGRLAEGSAPRPAGTPVKAPQPPATAVGKRRPADLTTPFDFAESGLKFDETARAYRFPTPGAAAEGEVAAREAIRDGSVLGPRAEPSGVSPGDFEPQVTRVGKEPRAPRGDHPVVTATPLSDTEFKAIKQAYGHAADEHLAAELHYSKGGDEIVNPELRSGEPLSAAGQKLHDGLMAAYRLPESRLPRDVELYRGVSDKSGADAVRKRFANIKPGDVLEDPAFLSTAYTGAAGSRGEQVVLVINAPKGTPGLPIRSKFHGEGEILLPPRTRLRVDSVEMVPVGERWHFKDNSTRERLTEEMGGMKILPNGDTVFGRSGATHPPIKEVRVTVVEAPVAEASAARPPPVDHNAPLGQLSVRQIGEYQESLNKAFDAVSDRSPEYKALADKWDAAVARREAIASGKAAAPTVEYGAAKAVPSPSAPAGEDLLSALQGTSAKLGESRSIAEIGASSPARAEYVAQKAERTAEAAQHFREQAIAKKYAGSEMGAAEREAAQQSDVAAAMERYDLGKRAEWKVERGLPKTEGEWNTFYVVRPSELAESRLFGDALEHGDVSVSEYMGKKHRPIRLKMGGAEQPGMIQIEDGNHRLLAAAAAGDQPVMVDVLWPRRGVPHVHETSPINSNLERALGRRAAGAGHPLAVQRLEQAHDAAAERVITAVTPAERAAAEREVASIEHQLSRVGARPGVVEDIAAAAEVVTKYEKASAKLVEALGDAAPPAAQEAAAAVREAEAAAERKTMDRTTRAIDDHAEQQAAPRQKGDWKRDAKVQQHARGQGRPMSIEEWRAKYPARAAGPIDAPELNAPRGGPAGGLDIKAPTKLPGQQYIDAAKSGKTQADAAYARARAAEAEAKYGADRAKMAADRFRAEADAARPSMPGPAGKGKLATIATVVGVAGELGIPGIPKPHDIPVVGPLLGALIKYKAIKAAAGRFVGRVPATADARVAALAARTKDGIARAVDRTLGLAAKPAMRTAVVATAAVLGHRLFDDGEPDAPKGATPQQMAAVRIREIAAAAARPELVVQHVRRQLHGVTDPDLIAAAENHMVERFQYLASVMPKMPPADPLSKTTWLPSQAATSDLAQRLAVVNDPVHAFDNPTPATVDAAQRMNPQLFMMAKQRVMERLSDVKSPLPYPAKLKAAMLYGSELLAQSMSPPALAVLQATHAQVRAEAAPKPMSPPTPSIAAPTELTQMYDPGNQRRAARM